MTDTPADDEGAPAPATFGEERRRVPEPEGEPRLRRAEDELRARFAEELQEGEETQDRVAASREAIVELEHVSLAFDRPILELSLIHI